MATRYLFRNFFTSFCSIFATLFLILAVVFFLQIARITSMIEINFLELLYTFVLMLPKILAFCLPITFFVALSTMLYRLSKENESIVLFTLGYSPRKISASFGALAALFCATLLLNTAFLLPLAEFKMQSFITQKQENINPNFKAAEVGQSFGKYHIFVKSKNKDGSFNDVALYSDKEFLIAKKAFFNATSGELNLLNASVYGNKEELLIARFKRLVVALTNEAKSGESFSINSYWAAAFGLNSFASNDALRAIFTLSPAKRQILEENQTAASPYEQASRAKDLSIFVLLSLFAFATFNFAISFGIVTYRYERGVIYGGIFLILLGYFTAVVLLAKMPLVAILGVFGLFFTLSMFYFKHKILNKY